MQIIRTIAELRPALAGRERISLVPTMGNLHAGHLSLVRIARERSDVVVTSIFVNRLQFAPHEDFAEYPRTLERDCGLLADSGCDIVFAPGDAEVYPDAQTFTVVPPPELAGVLEGEFRPHFFTGVCTVVLKFFNMVRPDIAVFGKKDFQQLLVVRNMIREFALPIQLLPADIVRDPEGLALSSRNTYLDAAQRREAAQLHKVLTRIAAAIKTGRAELSSLEAEARDFLTARGWQPDYVAIRRRSNLREGSRGEPLVVLAAARLGSTRLIDNLEV